MKTVFFYYYYYYFNLRIYYYVPSVKPALHRYLKMLCSCDYYFLPRVKRECIGADNVIAILSARLPAPRDPLVRRGVGGRGEAAFVVS